MRRICDRSPVQVRQLIAGETAALERFSSSLLESYVEVRHAQELSQFSVALEFLLP